jgi:glucose-6-phosphate-specific signal transduction histidine kinase
VGLGSFSRLKHTGFGTQSMVERANALNGSLAVWHGQADDGGDTRRGTTVLVTLPLPTQA